MGSDVSRLANGATAVPSTNYQRLHFVIRGLVFVGAGGFFLSWFRYGVSVTGYHLTAIDSRHLWKFTSFNVLGLLTIVERAGSLLLSSRARSYFGAMIVMIAGALMCSALGDYISASSS
jgi:hypothetical protein